MPALKLRQVTKLPAFVETTAGKRASTKKSVYLAHQFYNTLNMNIEPGQRYLLDGKNEVIVLKAINRSNTLFRIEIPGSSVEVVEGERLTPIEEEKDVETENR